MLEHMTKTLFCLQHYLFIRQINVGANEKNLLLPLLLRLRPFLVQSYKVKLAGLSISTSKSSRLGFLS